MKEDCNLDQDDLVGLLKQTGVIMEGHFLLTSGRHSACFLQCSQLLQYPQHAEKVCRLMAEPFRNENIDIVIGPAMGGVILSYETARALGARALFAERTGEGKMALRRGFRVEAGEKVLVVEDAITTGGSVQKVLDLLAGTGAEIAGVSIIIDRTSGQVDFGAPLKTLLSMEIESYAPEDCPLCREKIPLKKPKG